MTTEAPRVEPESSTSSRAATLSRPASGRLMSLDAYRGFVMLLMVSAGLYMSRVAKSFPADPLWQFLGYQTDHAEWWGCTLWDLIQPSFMFMVGVALPFSIANRQARGEPFWKLLFHALWRAMALVLLGVFLSSTGNKQTDWNFVIVLAQIGLGYPFLWLLAWTRPRTQLIAAAVILVGYWAWFMSYQTGGGDHWAKGANAAAEFDRWFLNLFPREKPFEANSGGYQTLNFIPSLATMIFGLLAGELLRSNRWNKLWWLVGCGFGGLALGWALDASGVCPMVKRIWTPTFAIFSAGWTFLMLAVFYAVIDMKGWRKWAFPFVVAGMNSIALYCMSMLMKPFIRDRLQIHFGRNIFNIFDEVYAPMVQMTLILIILWLIAWWMYRRKIFLRI